VKAKLFKDETLIDEVELRDAPSWPRLISYLDKDQKIRYFVSAPKTCGDHCHYYESDVHYANYRFMLAEESK